jgi:hypothetical protein
VSNRLNWPYNNPPYYDFLKERPWFRGTIKPNDNQCNFSIGACWIGRTQYLRENNYPDRGMFERWHQHRDDMLLGDMVKETNAKWSNLCGWDSIFMVNKASRRGSL